MDCNSRNEKSSVLCKFGYVDYIVLASTLSIALAEEFNSQDLDILAAFFAVLSDELALIASVEDCFSDSPPEEIPSPVPDVALTRDKTKKTKSKRYKKKVYKKIKK